MVNSITLSLVLILATGSVWAKDVVQTTASQPSSDAFTVVTSREGISGAMPEFWVAHQWEDSPTYADRFSDVNTLSTTLNKGFAVVPEPGTVTLLALGIVGLLLRKRISR